ncbi:MAG: hypothetical protein ACD_10C00255G0001 [uncultured bacterium]|nr:MAG: hypothetical protein ACD_10C00255G0001 [uncultured bacterium]
MLTGPLDSLHAIFCGINEKADIFQQHLGDFTIDRLVLDQQNTAARKALLQGGLGIGLQCRLMDGQGRNFFQTGREPESTAQPHFTLHAHFAAHGDGDFCGNRQA